MVLDRGFSLIEVLVALLVLAVGVLGILALQLSTLRATREVTLQSAALRLATDMAEQLRGSTHSPEMLHAFSQFDSVNSSAATESGVACFGSENFCTPPQMASFVIRQWQQRIQQTLPSARVRVCRDASPWHTATNTLHWDCDTSSDATTPLWIKIGWRDSQSKATTTPPVPQLALPVAVFSR